MLLDIGSARLCNWRPIEGKNIVLVQCSQSRPRPPIAFGSSFPYFNSANWIDIFVLDKCDNDDT